MPTQSIVRSATRKWFWGWDRRFCDGSVISQPEVGVWGNYPRDSYIKTRNWNRTPGYRTLVAQGKHLPDNSYNCIEVKVCDQVIDLRATQPVNVCTPGSSAESERIYYDHVQSLYLPYATGNRQLSENALRASLIDRARGAEWSAPVFVLEGRQTVNLVLNAARTIGSAYRNLRRGNFVGALSNLGVQGNESARRRYNRQYGRDPTRAAANAWLSLTYGWRPLVNDVYNSMETLAETNSREQNREIRVTSSSRRNDVEVADNYLISGSPNIKGTRTLVTEESCRGVWRCKPTSWNVAGSFGLLNPALVAWELLPFSFVVDWFLPVGRYLEGMDVPMRFQHLGGSIGYKRQVKTYYTNWKYENLSTSGGGVYETTYVTVQRDPLGSAPTVGLDSIVFEPKLGASRVTSAIALLGQTFR